MTDNWTETGEEWWRHKNRHVYLGDLHRHSNVSRCAAGIDLDLDDHFRFAQDIGGYDFWAMTDHAEHTTELNWHLIRKLSDAHTIPGHHVPMIGFEWSSFLHGHLNVIYRGDDGPIYSSRDELSDTPEKLWALLGDTEALTIPHHPSSHIYPTDWDSFDPRFVRVVEVFQAATGSYESGWCFRQSGDAIAAESSVKAAFERGHRLGLIASTDHGYGAGYAGVFAEHLSREAVFDALSDRRCFGATARGVIPWLEIGDAWMGGALETSGTLLIRYGARGQGGLSQIHLVKNGAVVDRIVAPARGLPAGWIRVPVDVRWESQAEGPRDWTGSATLTGPGAITEAPYWHPAVTDVGPNRVTWVAGLPEAIMSWHRPPGVGTLGFTVDGPADGRLSVTIGPVRFDVALGDVTEDVVISAGGVDHQAAIMAGTGSLVELGAEQAEKRLEMTLRPGDHLYVRAIRADGEAAWSSPIWIGRSRP